MIKLTDTEILLQAKTDPKLQEQIVNDNIEFIWFALWKNTKPYINKEDAGFDFEDLYQEACLAFVEAIHRFDPKKAAFTTFAESMIRWRLLRFFRDNHPGGVHLMRSKIDEGFKVPIDSLDRPIDGDEVREAALNFIAPELPTPGEAWGEVLQAVREYGFYRPDEALESLSPAVRRAVECIGWREVCLEDETMIRAHFLRVYESLYETAGKTPDFNPGMKGVYL